MFYAAKFRLFVSYTVVQMWRLPVLHMPEDSLRAVAAASGPTAAFYEAPFRARGARQQGRSEGRNGDEVGNGAALKAISVRTSGASGGKQRGDTLHRAVCHRPANNQTAKGQRHYGSNPQSVEKAALINIWIQDKQTVDGFVRSQCTYMYLYPEDRHIPREDRVRLQHSEVQ
ncbi:hypothetical protein Q8A73_015561 [Channa argus]|nr:hypothetical protein Q8A73_015561 [Channa argus]